MSGFAVEGANMDYDDSSGSTNGLFPSAILTCSFRGRAWANQAVPNRSSTPIQYTHGSRNQAHGLPSLSPVYIELPALSNAPRPPHPPCVGARRTTASAGPSVSSPASLSLVQCTSLSCLLRDGAKRSFSSAAS